MPYFKEFNVLFIHIPKTGGSNIENYFFYKSKKKPNINNLLSNNLNIKINNHSFQHMTFKEYYQNKEYFNLNFVNIKLISVVRNPYDRIISDLFYLKIANKNNSQKEIENIIKNYLENNLMYDNHKLEQYKFLIDDNNIIHPNILILRCEELNQHMNNIGFNDFSDFCTLTNTNLSKNKNYTQYLNKNSIQLINNFYKLDFEYFNYKMF